MQISLATLSMAAFRLGTLLYAAYRERLKRQDLVAEVYSFDCPPYLQGLDVRLRNVSLEPLHVSEAKFVIPNKAPIAGRWRIPIWFPETGPTFTEWTDGPSFPIGYDLDPAQSVNFEIAFPPGFALHPSRSRPVVIALSYKTRGWRERIGTKYLIRRATA